MSMLEFAKEELDRAGLYRKDSDYGGMIGEAVEELFEVFCRQGHSGFSASLVSAVFKKLVEGKPLSPLQGTPDEWMEVVDGLFQNKRMASVFAEGGRGEGAYNVDGVVFINKRGAAFTCNESRVPVTFPSIPETVTVKEGSPEAKEYENVFV